MLDEEDEVSCAKFEKGELLICLFVLGFFGLERQSLLTINNADKETHTYIPYLQLHLKNRTYVRSQVIKTPSTCLILS